MKLFHLIQQKLTKQKESASRGIYKIPRIVIHLRKEISLCEFVSFQNISCSILPWCVITEDNMRIFLLTSWEKTDGWSVSLKKRVACHEYSTPMKFNHQSYFQKLFCIARYTFQAVLGRCYHSRYPPPPAYGTANMSFDSPKFLGRGDFCPFQKRLWLWLWLYLWLRPSSL